MGVGADFKPAPTSGESTWPSPPSKGAVAASALPRASFRRSRGDGNLDVHTPFHGNPHPAAGQGCPRAPSKRGWRPLCALPCADWDSGGARRAACCERGWARRGSRLRGNDGWGARGRRVGGGGSPAGWGYVTGWPLMNWVAAVLNRLGFSQWAHQPVSGISLNWALGMMPATRWPASGPRPLLPSHQRTRTGS